MQNLNDFTKKIDEKFAADEEQILAYRESLNHQHEVIAARLGIYAKIADRIINTVIQPRMKKLVSYFKNASLSSSEPNGFDLICRFERIPRFPASTIFDFLVSHDADIKKIDITFSLQILPVFLKFDKSDTLSFSLDDLDESRLAEWVENRLLYFLDTYLKLEHIEQYQKQNIVRDPVCGAQVNKAFAISETGKDSQSYYFCNEDCRVEFVSDSGRYAPFRRLEDGVESHNTGSVEHLSNNGHKSPLSSVSN
jgi:YHS domain-containing protein